jgi:hypothetical protein
MGFTYIKIRVYSIDLTKWEDVEVLVNSGVLFTLIPRSILERLGLKPLPILHSRSTNITLNDPFAIDSKLLLSNRL